MIAAYIALGVAGCAIAVLALLRTSKNEQDIKALKASMKAKDKS